MFGFVGAGMAAIDVGKGGQVLIAAVSVLRWKLPF